MILSYNNYIDSEDSTIYANSEASGYPVENLQDPQLAKVYRSEDISSEYIILDAGSAVSIDGAFVGNHNITDSATIKIEANSTNDWASPAVSYDMNYKSNIIYYIFDSAQSYRYWRILVEDNSNPDGYIQIGRVSICQLAVFGDIIKSEFSITKERSDTRKFSLSGQLFADEGVEQKLWAVQLPHIDNDEKVLLDAVYADKGLHTPLFFILNEDDIPTYDIYYAVFNDNISYNHIFGNIWNANLAFKQVY